MDIVLLREVVDVDKVSFPHRRLTIAEDQFPEALRLLQSLRLVIAAS